MEFLIGQRVIVGNEIGVVTRGPTVRPTMNQDTHMWVHLSSSTRTELFEKRIVKPLPNGQL